MAANEITAAFRPQVGPFYCSNSAPSILSRPKHLNLEAGAEHWPGAALALTSVLFIYLPTLISAHCVAAARASLKAVRKALRCCEREHNKSPSFERPEERSFNLAAAKGKSQPSEMAFNAKVSSPLSSALCATAPWLGAKRSLNLINFLDKNKSLKPTRLFPSRRRLQCTPLSQSVGRKEPPTFAASEPFHHQAPSSSTTTATRQRGTSGH